MAYDKSSKATKAKTTRAKNIKLGQSTWLNIKPFNPVQDIFDPNSGPSSKANAPEANKARGGRNSSKSQGKKK